MFCQHCGADVDKAWAYCKSCGGKQKSAHGIKRRDPSSEIKQKSTDKSSPWAKKSVEQFLENLELVVWKLDSELDWPKNDRVGPSNNTHLYVITDPDIRLEDIDSENLRDEYGGQMKWITCFYCETEFENTAKDFDANKMWGVIDDGSKTKGGTCLPCLVTRLIGSEVWVLGPLLDDEQISLKDEFLVSTSRGGGWRYASRKKPESGRTCPWCSEKFETSSELGWWIDFDLYVHDRCLKTSGESICLKYPTFSVDIEKAAE